MTTIAFSEATTTAHCPDQPVTDILNSHTHSLSPPGERECPCVTRAPAGGRLLTMDGVEFDEFYPYTRRHPATFSVK